MPVCVRITVSAVATIAPAWWKKKQRRIGTLWLLSHLPISMPSSNHGVWYHFLMTKTPEYNRYSSQKLLPTRIADI